MAFLRALQVKVGRDAPIGVFALVLMVSALLEEEATFSLLVSDAALNPPPCPILAVILHLHALEIATNDEEVDIDTSPSLLSP